MENHNGRKILPSWVAGNVVKEVSKFTKKIYRKYANLLSRVSNLMSKYHWNSSATSKNSRQNFWISQVRIFHVQSFECNVKFFTASMFWKAKAGNRKNLINPNFVRKLSTENVFCYVKFNSESLTLSNQLLCKIFSPHKKSFMAFQYYKVVVFLYSQTQIVV